MNDSLDVSTIVFAALAIFVVWKLRSVLGTRTGEERPPSNPFARRARTDAEPPKPGSGKVIALPTAGRPAVRQPEVAEPWKNIAAPGSTLAGELDRVAAAMPSFSGPEFLNGARAAYEMILAAFAKGDRSALAGLLAKDVLDGFSAAIADREARGDTMTHAMVAIDKANILHAQLQGGSAQIAVRFDSHQVNTLRDRQGVVQGTGTEAVGPVVDEWTFARSLTSRDPNWTLVSTSAD
ncbi:Tim44/TimA family putative adaptor protein [Lichenihabitans sp. Uapishka_5]|uniref:Tim44/TimA family putative adaptor protein n=1 Tax=Lichenihabitans sp. Uapishka_5 TaxID=3037302 RepID=UPI0029E8136F|nr:Tim44/TimA family putative adaptor protein [Lichenihabitans sp. Uapishka_5]MDX7951440.1 Tim44/TimA family putative adaptor protein [Lichenihabitans sp. Uapishka_5]